MPKNIYVVLSKNPFAVAEGSHSRLILFLRISDVEAHGQGYDT